MSMFGDIATEHTVHEIVKEIKAEMAIHASDIWMCRSLKRIGRVALSQLEYTRDTWDEEYRSLFREEVGIREIPGSKHD